MEQETFTCALEGCNVVGVKTTHNQKYCSTEHCREATNAKLMERYHEAQAIKKGKKRLCRTCGITRLSRYNPGRDCSGCQTSGRVERNSGLTDLASMVTVV